MGTKGDEMTGDVMAGIRALNFHLGPVFNQMADQTGERRMRYYESDGMMSMGTDIDIDIDRVTREI